MDRLPIKLVDQILEMLDFEDLFAFLAVFKRYQSLKSRVKHVISKSGLCGI
jgi:hypothetical protein